MEEARSRADYYDRRQVMAVLGVSRDTVQRMADTGTIKAAIIVGNKHYYLKADIDALKKSLYPEGMTFKQIADRYGLAVNTVKKNFKQQGVKPLGRHRFYQSVVFAPDTVKRVARSLGWLENPTSEASSPAAAGIAVAGLS